MWRILTNEGKGSSGPQVSRMSRTQIFHALSHPTRPPLSFLQILVHTLQRQNTEISKQIFPEKEYRGLSPNFHIHVSVSNLYIPMIDLPIMLQEICGLILGIYKSLTDTWMWKLGLRLKKVGCQGILHIERGFSEKCPLSQGRFWISEFFLVKKLANQKWISSKCGYLSKINQGSGPTRVSTGFCSFKLFLQVTHLS